jgi:predicted metal-dependent HD superfamily phosphohydrolase
VASISVERFLAALPTGADRGAMAAALGAELIQRWSEPHRRYHTLDHLDTVLSIVDANARLAADLSAVRLAAWFHDAVYDPTTGPGGNEDASAELAGVELGAVGLNADTTAEVARLIRLTADHDAGAGDANGCLLADADLAILAAEPDDYNRYAAAIRDEFRHVPDPMYRVGRGTVLRNLLDQPLLYRVVPARMEWTGRARANLRRELDLLEAG